MASLGWAGLLSPGNCQVPGSAPAQDRPETDPAPTPRCSSFSKSAGVSTTCSHRTSCCKPKALWYSRKGDVKEDGSRVHILFLLLISWVTLGQSSHLSWVSSSSPITKGVWTRTCHVFSHFVPLPGICPLSPLPSHSSFWRIATFRKTIPNPLPTNWGRHPSFRPHCTLCFLLQHLAYHYYCLLPQSSSPPWASWRQKYSSSIFVLSPGDSTVSDIKWVFGNFKFHPVSQCDYWRLWTYFYHFLLFSFYLRFWFFFFPL